MGADGDVDPAAGDSVGVSARFHAPAGDLAGFVIDYAIYDSGPAGSCPRRDLYAPGPPNVTLTFDAGPVGARIRHFRHEWTNGAALFGPTSRAIHVDSNGGRLIGFGLSPLGWSRLIPHPAAEFANRVTPLAAVMGATAERRLYAALAAARDDRAIVAALDRELRRWLLPPGDDDAAIGAMTALLFDPAISDVSTITDRLALDARRLRRITLRYFGFPPKILLRRARFMRALMTLAQHGGDAESAPPGYHDYSHFIRDAKLFLDTTGKRFLRDITPLMDAMRRGRLARFGQPLQGLIAPGRDNVPASLDGPTLAA